MGKVITSIILLIGIAALVFFWYVGFFTKVNIDEVQAGPYTLAYQSHQGDYAFSPQIMDKVFAWLKEKQIHPTQGFGIYFDNPREVEKPQLRSVIGNIIPASEKDKINIAATQYQLNDFPQQKCLQVVFPYRSPLSIMAGIMKVYPAVTEYARVHKLTQHAAIEIYDIPKKQIVYLFPLEPEANLIEKYFQNENDVSESNPPASENTDAPAENVDEETTETDQPEKEKETGE
jgi:GyrI-like small molecule binding domain